MMSRHLACLRISFASCFQRWKLEPSEERTGTLSSFQLKGVERTLLKFSVQALTCSDVGLNLPAEVGTGAFVVEAAGLKEPGREEEDIIVDSGGGDS